MFVLAAIADRAVASIILAALHPDPERRPQTARQLAILLAEATPGDHLWSNGIEIIKNCARELLDIGNVVGLASAVSKSGR